MEKDTAALKAFRRNLKDKTIYVLPYCHADVAWRHSRLWHLNRYALVLDEALDIMDAHPQFCYFMDSWTEMLRPYLELRPQNRDRMARLMREGRLALCGGHYGNVRIGTIANETVIRNMTVGLEKVREVFPTFEPLIYSNLDVGIGYSQVPQIMKLGGFSGYFAWRPQAGLDAQGIPRSFVWQGLSGDAVQVCRFCYSGLNVTPEGGWHRDWEASLEVLLPEIGKSAEQAGVSAIGMCMGADDSRPLRRGGDDAPNMADELIESWNKDGLGAMRYGTPEHLFKHLASEELPTVGPILDQAEVCYKSNVSGHRGLWWWREKADRALVEAELFDALACARGARSSQSELAQGWLDTLEIGPHAQQFLFREDEQQRFELGQRAVRRAEQVRDRSLNALLSTCLPLDSTHLALVNPIPWGGRRLVRTVIPNSDKTRKSFRLLDDEGAEIPCQLRDMIDPYTEYDIEFYADLPPCGYATCRVEWWGEEPQIPQTKPLSLDAVVEHQGLTLRFSSGLITAIQDQERGLSWEAEGGASFLEPLVQEYEAVGWRPVSLCEDALPSIVTELRQEDVGPVCRRLSRVIQAGPNRFRQEIGIYGKAREIRVATTTNLCQEGVFAGVALPVGSHAALTVDVPFGVEPRNPEEVPYGDFSDLGYSGSIERVIPGYFWGRSWLDASGAGKGMTLLSADGERYYWRHPSDRSIVHFLTRTPVIPEKGWETRTLYAHLPGTDCFHHCLVLHGGDYREAGIIHRAEMLRFPVRALPVKLDGIGTRETWLSVSPQAVRLSALYVKEDAAVLRVYNASAEPQQGLIVLPDAPGEATLVDFHLNRLDGDVEVSGKELTLGLKPWQIATVRISP